MSFFNKKFFPGFLTKPYFLLILIILFHGILNWMVLQEDNVPFSYDEATHYEHTMRAHYHLIENFSFDRNFINKYLNIFSFYPPLYNLFQLPIYLIFGNSQDLSVMVNIVFLGILVFSVYGIGKEVLDRKTGLFSSLLVSTVPAIFGFSRTNFRVIALTSIVALSIYLLLRCSNFSSRKYSLLFGLTFGAGFLAALHYPVYIFLPLVICIARGRDSFNKKRTINLFISILTGMIIFFMFWFGLHLFKGGYFKEFKFFMKVPLNFITYLSSPWFYFKNLIHQLYLFHFVLFVATLSVFIFLKFRNKYFFLSWIIFPLIFFSFYCFKESRYMIPVLPATGLITGFVIFRIRNFKFRKLCYLIISGIVMTQVIWLSLSDQPAKCFTEEDYQLKRQGPGLIHAYQVDWPTDKILSLLQDYKLIYREDNKVGIIIAIAEGPFIHHFHMLTRLNNLTGRTQKFPYLCIPVFNSPHSIFEADIGECIYRPDYIIIQRGLVEQKRKKIKSDMEFWNKDFKSYNFFKNALGRLNSLMSKLEKNEYSLLTTFKVEEEYFDIYIYKKTRNRIKLLKENFQVDF